MSIIDQNAQDAPIPPVKEVVVSKKPVTLSTADTTLRDDEWFINNLAASNVTDTALDGGEW